MLSLVLCVASFSVGATSALGEPLDDSLEIELRARRADLTQGDPLDFYLHFRNRGEQPFYIERPVGFGSDSVSVVARREDCEYRVSAAHLDSPLSALRFRYVPLMADDDFRMALPTINAGSRILIPLPTPGHYRFTVHFHSIGDHHEGLIWPIWRGRAVSNVVEIKIEAANQARTERWVRRLEDCATKQDCEILEVLEAIQPFETTVVPGVAPLLRSLLRSDPGANSAVASALLLQGDSSDAQLLRELAATVEESRTREYLFEVADGLASRRREACR